jgi:Cu(I)/Ag(I) efflux system membrane fusion protein
MNSFYKSEGRLPLPVLAALIIGLTGGVFSSTSWAEGQSDSSSAAAMGHADKEILYWVAPMDPDYRSDKPGKSPMGMDMVPVYAEEKTAEREVLYWVAPMDPDYRSDKPGKSPMGMDLVPVYAEEKTHDLD